MNFQLGGLDQNIEDIHLNLTFFTKENFVKFLSSVMILVSLSDVQCYILELRRMDLK